MMPYQKAAPIWLPCAKSQCPSLLRAEDVYLRIDRSGGEPVGEKLVSIVVLRAKQANAGHACCFRGAG